MSSTELVLGIVLILFSVSIILVVLLQEGHQNGVGVVTGGSSDTFYSKNKARSLDAFLERWTKFISIGFFLLVVATNAVIFFL